jgi:hypothetical protein
MLLWGGRPFEGAWHELLLAIVHGDSRYNSSSEPCSDCPQKQKGIVSCCVLGFLGKGPAVSHAVLQVGVVMIPDGTACLCRTGQGRGNIRAIEDVDGGRGQSDL